MKTTHVANVYVDKVKIDVLQKGLNMKGVFGHFLIGSQNRNTLKLGGQMCV